MRRKVNDLNNLTTTASNEQRKIRKKHILAFERQKHVIVVILVVTWTLFTSLSHCLDNIVVVFVAVVQTSLTSRTHNANNVLCFEQINVELVEMNDIYIQAVTFTYY